jgi:hypothetical protein
MVGDARARKVDVRIIAATNKDLPSLIQSRVFREELYYRINVVTSKSCRCSPRATVGCWCVTCEKFAQELGDPAFLRRPWRRCKTALGRAMLRAGSVIQRIVVMNDDDLRSRTCRLARFSTCIGCKRDVGRGGAGPYSQRPGQRRRHKTRGRDSAGRKTCERRSASTAWTEHLQETGWWTKGLAGSGETLPSGPILPATHIPISCSEYVFPSPVPHSLRILQRPVGKGLIRRALTSHVKFGGRRNGSCYLDNRPRGSLGHHTNRPATVVRLCCSGRWSRDILSRRCKGRLQPWHWENCLEGLCMTCNSGCTCTQHGHQLPFYSVKNSMVGYRRAWKKFGPTP